ncbi:MAG TPA: hypothetical protein VK978_03225 [Candidatus Saccharimonadales bacterium]|nr:hypothetical protein [Candidatus Saccharimonadales bacterium]
MRKFTGRLAGAPVIHDLRRTPSGRIYAGLLLGLFLVSTIAAALQPFVTVKAYAVDAAARQVLPEQNTALGELLKFDATQQGYEYNAGYTGAVNPESAMNSTAAPRITASFAADPSKGVRVTDPLSKIDFGLKPVFGLGRGRQDKNQIMYPLSGGKGYLVYTAQVSGVKEDILLGGFIGDKVTYEYELDMQAGLEARLEANGSVGVYGAALPILGNVSTGTDQDRQLLEKARKHAQKTKLLFTLPAPVVVETGKKQSQVKARFELNGARLKLVAENLKGASYPLSIDPSVYVETAQKLMRGNNETNVDFDVPNELIKKGKLSGGRFDNWTGGLALPAERWAHGTAVGGGYMYVVGGMQGNTRTGTVYWSKFNTTNNAINAPNPGNGACASWCTGSAYDLPVATSAHTLVSYNGFLYVMGGETDAGRTNTVYIAKLGANGEPSLWHPTDNNKASWVYWHAAGNLGTERSLTAAVAYNNRMYLLGGRTNSSTGGVTTVEYADINPIGTLGTWTTTGMVALPSVRHSHSTLVYNDRLYIIGGNSAGVLQSSVQYIKLNSNGTLAGSWVSTTPMTKPRMSPGGNFATIWGGYIYVAGGCSAITGTGDWCSVSGLSDARDIQIASINADGSVTKWTNITGVTHARMGYGLVSWRETIYGIGGCTNQDEVTGACISSSSVTDYGRINPDGDVSTTNNSTADGSGTCTGTNPTNCDIPPAGDNAGQGGRLAMGVAVNNGYLYVIGGCTDVSTTEECFAAGGGRMSGNISYSAFAVDGSLVRPPTCVGTFYGHWCVDSTNRLNGTTGLGAMSVAIFNNTIYSVGGTDGSTWSDRIFRVGLNDNGSLAGAWSNQRFNTIGIGGIGYGFSYTFTRANPISDADPGNLYIMGGCNAGAEKSNGIGCTTYFSTVWKCNITSIGDIGSNSCTTTGQLQIDAEPGSPTTNEGLAGMAGTLYANYIYLVGGTSPNEPTRGKVMYAKIDNNNNIVPANGTIWTTSPNEISPARLRGAAFGYNGYLYSLAGFSGTNSLNDVLYAKIDVSNGSIGTFKTSLVTVSPRWELRAIVANGFVYAVGGCSEGAAPSGCTAMTGVTQTFQLYNNYSGTPAGYKTTPSIGVDRIGGSAAIMNGYIYYAGGCTAIDCSAVSDTVYYAPLGADGSVGAWTASTTGMGGARAWGKLLAVGGTLYYVGGQDATAAQSTIFFNTPSSGVPGAWAAASNGLPVPLTEVGATLWNDDRIFVTGGVSGGARQSGVYYSPILSRGGDITTAWTSTTGFKVARSGHVSISYANNLYVIGGYSGTSFLNDVQFAKINADGTVVDWQYTTSLPQRVYQADGFAANGYLYVIGGRSNATTCTNNTYIASVSANTTIASGNRPTGVGEWSQTNVEYAGARYGVAAAYDQGRAYVLGGGCSAFVAAADRAYLSALQSQPQVAKYSRMIDTDTDVFPTKWLMNGLDNAIGARWKMRYRSSTAAAVSWGQETDFGTVTLGRPENYIPLDSGGVNTNFARYFYLSVSIDSSRAFGYPEDVTRGPTIDDMSLFFTSDPGKRLRHGATFTGGQLQPLDTPFP